MGRCVVLQISIKKINFFSSSSLRMSGKNIRFGDKEVKRIFANFKNEGMFKHRTRIDAVIPF